MKPRAAFLDRDGVLNRSVVRAGTPTAPSSVEELEILPGVDLALARLKAAGYRLVVVTNQPDIGRGKTPRSAVDAIHARMAALLPIDEFRVCPHDDGDACACRKPRPGLLLDPPTVDVANSVLIGDQWRDIDAGRAAGCRAALLVDYHYDTQPAQEPDARVDSLSAAAEWILARFG